MPDAYIIGTYSTRFKKWPEKSHKDLTRDAYLGVLEDAGMTNGDQIEFAWFGNSSMAGWGQPSIRSQVCFSPLVEEGLFPQRVPMVNVEGARATASMALHGAWNDILSGQTASALRCRPAACAPSACAGLRARAARRGFARRAQQARRGQGRSGTDGARAPSDEDSIWHQPFGAAQAAPHRPAPARGRERRGGVLRGAVGAARRATG